VKPNMGWDSTPRQGANTHPDVVAEVVRACRDGTRPANHRDRLPDRRGRRAFERSGIMRAALEAGAESCSPSEPISSRAHLRAARGVERARALPRGTKIINVPIGKHHP